MIRNSFRFLISLAAACVAAAVLWEAVFPGKIYHCTDSIGLDFFAPGEWIHEPHVTVERIDGSRPMGSPDQIRAGWSLGGLWAVWWGMSTLALAGAVGLTRASRQRSRTEKSQDETGRRSGKRRTGCAMLASGAAVMALGMGMILFLSLYGEYGAFNIERAIRLYMERNDDRWPSSWEDIEPFHDDIIFPTRSVAVVKLFHEVHWDVEPWELYREMKANPDLRPARTEKVGPVIFRRRHHERHVERRVLTPRLYRYFEDREKAAEGRE